MLNQNQVKLTREEAENVRKMKQALYSSKKELAHEIKIEASQLRKQRARSDKRFIKRVQERRFELHIQSEASRLKQLQDHQSRVEAISKCKDESMLQETSVISKKMKQAKRLEKQEVVVLERLKQTYAKQQQAIFQIEEMFSDKESLMKQDLNKLF